MRACRRQARSEDIMTSQLDFDFGEQIIPEFSEAPYGTWLSAKFTVDEYQGIFAKASAGLQRVVGPARPLFREAIENALAQLTKMAAQCPRANGEAFSLWRSDFTADIAPRLAFIAHCVAMADSSFPGIEYKVRTAASTSTAAMYVHDVGTIIVRQWASDNIGIDYYPGRHHIFMDSYRDRVERFEVPYTVWGRAYCADKLAMAGQNVATIPTFSVNGREYINDGTTSRGSFCECRGWTFCTLENWTGPTYTYASQCKAWDEGRCERGDRRGLVVRVRGQLCVIDGVMEFFDNNAHFEIHHSDNDDSSELAVDQCHEQDEVQAEVEAGH